MTATLIPAPARLPVDTRAPGAVLDVVVPVHNEEADLPRCVRRLHAHLARAFPYPFRITVADNAVRPQRTGARPVTAPRATAA